MDKIENKIFLSLVTGNYFKKEYNFVINKICADTEIKKKEVEKSLKKLQNAKKIEIKNGKIFDVEQLKKDNEILEQSRSSDISQSTIQKITDENVITAGTVKKTNKGLYCFIPFDKNLPIGDLVQNEETKNALGKNCCVKVVTANSHGMYCTLDKVFDNSVDHDSRYTAIAYKHGFHEDSSPKVEEEIKKIKQYVTDEEKAERKDMTALNFLPIDPNGCKDKDDAICVEKTKDGYRCYIAIADVPHYIKPGTALDLQSRIKAMSVYPGNSVIPMTPKELSNGILSLNEGVDRLALVWTIDIDNNGNVLNSQFDEATIKVKHSLSYEQAEKIHLAQEGYEKTFADIKPTVDMLYDATDALDKRYQKNGMIHFKNQEFSFNYGADKKQILDVDISNKERSHFVVENFMILANEATAKYISENSNIGVYRVHDKLLPIKFEELKTLLRKYKVSYNLENSSKSIQGLVDMIKDDPKYDYLSDQIMSKLSKACYSSTNIGHFGIALEFYSHFTSGIRRYMDIIAQRICKDIYHNRESYISKSEVDKICEYVNLREREADLVDKDCQKYSCALLAQNQIGNQYNCFITRIIPGFLEVKRTDVGVKFLVPTSELIDGKSSYYKTINNEQTLTNGKRQYNVGDKISVKITNSDLETCDITAKETDEKIIQKVPEQTPAL